MFGGFPSRGLFGGPSLFGPGSVFDDPFFRDPFRQMDQMMQAHTRSMNAHMGHRAQAPPQQSAQHHSRSQPLIEEVHDEDEDMDKRTGSHAAVVEEPDEEVASPDRPSKRKEPDTASTSSGPAHVDRRPATHTHNHRHSASGSGSGRQIAVGGGRLSSLLDAFFGGSLSEMMQRPMGQGGGGGATSFSYSSTTYTSSGPGGVTYQSSHTERVGPGGVREVQRTVRDGRTGQQSMTITRGLGDKEKTVTRTRDATGRVHGEEVLRGIHDHEADRFDHEWIDHAERTLLHPGGGLLGGTRGPGTRASGHTHTVRGPLQLPAPPAQPAYQTAHHQQQPAYVHTGVGHGATHQGHAAPRAHAHAPQLSRQPSGGYGAAHAAPRAPATGSAYSDGRGVGVSVGRNVHGGEYTNGYGTHAYNTGAGTGRYV